MSSCVSGWRRRSKRESASSPDPLPSRPRGLRVRSTDLDAAAAGSPRISAPPPRRAGTSWCPGSTKQSSEIRDELEERIKAQRAETERFRKDTVRAMRDELKDEVKDRVKKLREKVEEGLEPTLAKGLGRIDAGLESLKGEFEGRRAVAETELGGVRRPAGGPRTGWARASSRSTPASICIRTELGTTLDDRVDSLTAELRAEFSAAIASEIAAAAREPTHRLESDTVQRAAALTTTSGPRSRRPPFAATGSANRWATSAASSTEPA